MTLLCYRAECYFSTALFDLIGKEHAAGWFSPRERNFKSMTVATIQTESGRRVSNRPGLSTFRDGATRADQSRTETL
jgi:hypothetical protein